MATPVQTKMTVAEFDAWVIDAEQRYEYIAGEIFEVPSGAYVSAIAAKILLLIGIYLMKNDLGRLTGEAGGYMVGGDRYAPDVAFISYVRQPEFPRKGYCPNPPDLAVEVVSNPDNAQEQNALRLKLSSYLAAGVVVWIVNPDTKVVEIHQAGKSPRSYSIEDTLDGGNVLPGFILAVKDIFPEG